MILDDLYRRTLNVDEVQRQSIATFISKIVLTFIGFLSTMYFAHMVGSSVLGTYFLFTAYFGIIYIFTDGGLGGAAVKRISEGEEQDEYFTAFVVIRATLTIVIITLILALRPYMDTNPVIFDWLIIALIISSFHCMVSNGIKGRSKMGIAAAGSMTKELTRLFVQVISVLLGFEIGGLIGGFIAGFIVATIMMLKFFDLKFKVFKWNHVKQILSFSFWLFLTASGVALYSHSDVVLIGYFLEESDVGVYQVVFQFTAIATILAGAIKTTLWPKVSRWGKIYDTRSVENSISRGLTYSFLMAFPIIIGGILLGERMLYFFYGAGFAWGYTALIILFSVKAITILNSFFTMSLSALDRQKDAFIVTAFSATINIVLNILLIPQLGIEGAALATAITITVNTVLSGYILSRIIQIRIEFNSLINIIKGTSIMALFVMVYITFVQLESVWLTLLPIFVGAIIYIHIMIRLEPKIYHELKAIYTKLNLPWGQAL